MSGTKPKYASGAVAPIAALDGAWMKDSYGASRYQMTPLEGYLREAEASLTCSAMRSTTTVPNPLRCGVTTGGPFFSCHCMKKRCSPASVIPQVTATVPLSFERAPYFDALVASS